MSRQLIKVAIILFLLSTYNGLTPERVHAQSFECNTRTAALNTSFYEPVGQGGYLELNLPSGFLRVVEYGTWNILGDFWGSGVHYWNEPSNLLLFQYLSFNPWDVATITICNPISEPTATPTPAPVPAGCFVQGIAMQRDHVFAETSMIYSWSERVQWLSSGIGSQPETWVNLPSYSAGLLSYEVPAGYTERFRSSPSTYAELLICPQAATPTATATVGGGADPNVENCETFYASDNSIRSHNGIYHYRIPVSDIVGSKIGYAVRAGSLGVWINNGYVLRSISNNLYSYVNDDINMRSGVYVGTGWQSDLTKTYNTLGASSAYYATLCVQPAVIPTPTASPSPSPTGTLTTTPTGTPTGTTTRTPLPTRTATNTATATGTPLPTPSPTVTLTPIHGRPPGLSCAIADSFNLPKPIEWWMPPEDAYREIIYLVEGGEFAVVGADASVYFRIDGDPYWFDEGVYTWNHPTGEYMITASVIMNWEDLTILDDFPATIWVCNYGPTPTTTPTVTGTPTGTPTATATPTPIGEPVLPCLYSTYFVGWSTVYVPFSQGQLYQVLDYPIQVELEGNWYSLSGVGIWNEPSGTYTVRGTGVAPSRLAVCVGTGTPTITPLAYTPTPNPNAIGLRFEQGQRSVREDAGSLEVVVILTKVMTYAVSVDLSTTSYTAMAHADFVFTNTTLTFYPGQTRITVAIPIIDDLIVEPDEIFHVRLTNPQSILVSQQHSGGRAGLMAPAPQLLPQVGLGWPAVKEVTIIDDDRDTLPTATIAEICVMVPATATAGTPVPWPTIPLELPTLKPLPPLPGAAGGLISGTPITATNEYTAAATLVAEWAAPANTITAWSTTLYGEEGPVARGEADAALLVERVAPALGWLGLWEMLGPLAYVLPPILIVLSVRLGRSVLAIVRYFRSIMPR